ncbi:flagellar hook-associated protein FlgK [Undibacterium sp.]|jgi:flagellar hook-associated protein 1 FlgK|uniref:flagellar hook-associated protein FlgK n=1 Tax=Undibacterium sp. TaxID=1914977 RepID=UPI002B6AA8AB|nr:flagellar hook-associated protein FlgK [Undibacterium sp.]HTD04145.1 flagellar hook-associated protein FlgK [Undibacterium sp.]
MSIINNALTGALAAQVALNTTSQNVANVKTPGYTRQGILLSALPPGAGPRSAGSGVEVSALLRFSDGYKSQQMWRAASDLGQRTLAQPYLTQLEQVMGDDASSISSGLDDFFKALNAVSVDPTSTPLRQQVITTANSMAQRVNSINNVMSNQRLSVQQQRTATVPQINVLSQNIATLNQKIASAQSTGTNTSALMDARDQAIDSLAGLVGVEVIDQPDGSRNVSLRSGQPLVLGGTASALKVQNNANGTQSLQLTFANQAFSLDGVSLGGQLGGLNDFENNVLLPLQQSVSDIAAQLASKMNAQLALGFAMDGTAGGPLFDYDPTSSSGMLKLNGTATAANLGFSADGTPGNSGNLQKIIALKSQPIAVSSIGNVLLGDADTQIVGKLGVDSQQNQSLLTTATTVRNQAVDDWKSTSGVNSDEEAISLVEYQKMYQANMKVISVANSLFDATLAMMG